jgi:hypothetical protein
MLACFLVAGVGLLGAAGLASAQLQQIQQGNPYYRPPVSPYLNIVGQNNPAINYFGIVKPQMDFNRQIQNLQYQQGVYAMKTQLGVPIEDDDPTAYYTVTGHPAMFGNLSHYYNNNPAAMGVTRPGQMQMPTLFGKRY